MLPNLDFRKSKSNGTWVAGFSDIFFSLRLDLSTDRRKDASQAPTASVLGDLKCDPYTIQTFFGSIGGRRIQILFSRHRFRTFKQRVCFGAEFDRLVFDARNQVLPENRRRYFFVEDIAEPAYKIERDLNHLLQAGVIDNQKAVVLGDF